MTPTFTTNEVRFIQRFTGLFGGLPATVADIADKFGSDVQSAMAYSILMADCGILMRSGTTFRLNVNNELIGLPQAATVRIDNNHSFWLMENVPLTSTFPGRHFMPSEPISERLYQCVPELVVVDIGSYRDYGPKVFHVIQIRYHRSNMRSAYVKELADLCGPDNVKQLCVTM